MVRQFVNVNLLLFFLRRRDFCEQFNFGFILLKLFLIIVKCVNIA